MSRLLTWKKSRKLSIFVKTLSKGKAKNVKYWVGVIIILDKVTLCSSG